MTQEILSVDFKTQFRQKVPLDLKIGRLLVKTVSSSDELLQAFELRYQAFQVEMAGATNASYGLDSDQFDFSADHLAIYDESSGQMIATCRLNSSLFATKFYSEQEFYLGSLLAKPETKLEIGRVCVRREFRKGAVILILWRAIAEYMRKTQTEILFGCGSVLTEDPRETLILYRYLEQDGRLRTDTGSFPMEKYRFNEFEDLLHQEGAKADLTAAETMIAESLLPPLIRSYFDIGCYVAGSPAIDPEFKCIDFLTVLEKKTITASLRKRMFGSA